MKGWLCPPGSREPGEGRGMARLRFTLQGWPRKPTLGEIAVLLCLLWSEASFRWNFWSPRSEQCRGLANARSLPHRGPGPCLPFPRPNEACCFLEAGANISHVGLSRQESICSAGGPCRPERPSQTLSRAWSCSGWRGTGHLVGTFKVEEHDCFWAAVVLSWCLAQHQHRSCCWPLVSHAGWWAHSDFSHLWWNAFYSHAALKIFQVESLISSPGGTTLAGGWAGAGEARWAGCALRSPRQPRLKHTRRWAGSERR